MSYCDIPQDYATGRPLRTASTLFIEALRADSNLEMDWLWLAEQEISASERAYSLRRALRINPESRAAQQALIALDAAPDAATGERLVQAYSAAGRTSPQH